MSCLAAASVPEPGLLCLESKNSWKAEGIGLGWEVSINPCPQRLQLGVSMHVCVFWGESPQFSAGSQRSL